MGIETVINGAVTIIATSILLFFVRAYLKHSREEVAKDSNAAIAALKALFDHFKTDNTRQVERLITGQNTLTEALNDLKLSYLPRREFDKFKDKHDDSIRRLHEKIEKNNA